MKELSSEQQRLVLDAATILFSKERLRDITLEKVTKTSGWEPSILSGITNPAKTS